MNNQISEMHLIHTEINRLINGPWHPDIFKNWYALEKALAEKLPEAGGSKKALIFKNGSALAKALMEKLPDVGKPVTEDFCQHIWVFGSVMRCRKCKKTGRIQ